jgi:tetratricopeptide (TPR) repeat protein
LVRDKSLAFLKARPGLVLGTGVFILTFIIFVRILNNEFVWDDSILITNTFGIRGLNFRHLHWMMTTVHAANFIPLSWLSYAIDYRLWKLNPLGYHLTNLIFHSLNAVLLFRLSMMVLPFSKVGLKKPWYFVGPAFASLAFSLHPLRVESVAWASERRDVLAGFFFLLMAIYYIKTFTCEASNQNKNRITSIIFFACACLSKATVVPGPVALFALDFYPLKRITTKNFVQKIPALAIEKIPYLGIALLTAILAILAQALAQNFTPLHTHDLSSRLTQSLFGLGFYLSKTILPVGLSALYPLPPRLHFLSSGVMMSAGILVIFPWVIHKFKISIETQIALWLYYATLLLPVLGLLQNGYQIVALRYSYLSCFGWAVLAGALAQHVAALHSSLRRRIGAVLLLTWLGFNIVQTQHQISIWSNDLMLWSDTVARFPQSAEANANLGRAFLDRQQMREAEFHARRAKAMSNDPRLWGETLASALLSTGRISEAQAELEMGLRSIPDWDKGHELLGVVLSQQGRSQEALPHLLRAAQLLPQKAATQINAGAQLALLGRFEQALPYFQAAVRLDPGNPLYIQQLEHVSQDIQKTKLRE